MRFTWGPKEALNSISLPMNRRTLAHDCDLWEETNWRSFCPLYIIIPKALMRMKVNFSYNSRIVHCNSCNQAMWWCTFMLVPSMWSTWWEWFEENFPTKATTILKNIIRCIFMFYVFIYTGVFILSLSKYLWKSVSLLNSRERLKCSYAVRVPFKRKCMFVCSLADINLY